MSELTHFNQAGEAHMVDIADKDQTHRIGIAEGWISMHPETFALVEKGNAKKGDVLAVARIAAIMGSKKTPDLIPLCHPIALTHVNVDFELYPEEHCLKAPELLREGGVSEDIIHGVVSHGYGITVGCGVTLDVEPIHEMEKVLFAADELTGLI